MVYDSIDAVSSARKPADEIDGLAKSVRAKASARWWREEGCSRRDPSDNKPGKGLCAGEDTVDALCGALHSTPDSWASQGPQVCRTAMQGNPNDKPDVEHVHIAHEMCSTKHEIIFTLGSGPPPLTLPRELPAYRKAIERPSKIVRGPP